MPSGYTVSADTLRAHAGKVAGRLDQVTEALDAARQVSMPTHAYGKICQFLPPKLDPVEQAGVEALQAAVESLETAARSLRDAASDYERQDQAKASGFATGTGP